MKFFWSLFLVIAAFSPSAHALKICGITISSKNSENFKLADGKTPFEVGFRAAMPQIKYYFTSDAMTGFTLLGEYALDSTITKEIDQSTAKSLIPGLLAQIKDATPGAKFKSESGEFIVGKSSRLEFNFAYELNGNPEMLESRLLIFQSPDCRIDAIFVATDGDKKAIEDAKTELLNAIHSGGKGNLWLVPAKPSTLAMSHTQLLVIGLIASLIGFLILFFADRRKKTTKR